MKKIQAYIAGDGSLHRTVAGAATADLMVILGATEEVAGEIVRNREAVASILGYVSSPYFILTHHESEASE